MLYAGVCADPPVDRRLHAPCGVLLPCGHELRAAAAPTPRRDGTTTDLAPAAGEFERRRRAGGRASPARMIRVRPTSEAARSSRDGGGGRAAPPVRLARDLAACSHDAPEARTPRTRIARREPAASSAAALVHAEVKRATCPATIG